MNVKPSRLSQSPAATYETTDLYLGAFLKAHGLQLVNRLLDGRRVTFVFADRPDRTNLVRDFYNNGQIRVNDLVHALQDLKAAIYNL